MSALARHLPEAYQLGGWDRINFPVPYRYRPLVFLRIPCGRSSGDILVSLEYQNTVL